MIYRIVCDGMELYGPNIEQSVISPHLEIELNAAGTLEFTLPVVMDRDETYERSWVNHDIWDQPQIFKSEIEVWEEDKIIWFGRPLQITRDWNNQRRVVCEGALAYFNDSIQRTWEMKPSAKHTNLYFFYNNDNKGIINVHNNQVEANRQFELGRVTIPSTSAYRKTDYDTTYDCIQNMCLAVDGGYIVLRKEKVGDSYVRYIDWFEELSDMTTNPQSVEFGVNLLDINQDLNGADVCTVLIATGADDSMLNKVPAVTPTEQNGWIGHDSGSDEIYHQKGIEKFGRVVQMKSWSDFDSSGGINSGLWHKATDWLKEKNTDIPTIEVSAADLHYISNEDISEELRSRDAFQLGTKVKVISGPHDMDQFLVIYKLSMDLDSGVKKVTLGTPPKRELTDIVAPSAGSGSTRGNGGKTGGNGEGGNSGGSTYIPVKDVRVKTERDGKYSSVVTKKIAEIDLSEVGKVQDVKVDGTSVVDSDKIANIVIPVKDVIKDNQSIVDGNGNVNLEAILAGIGDPTSNLGVPGDIYLELALDSGDNYFIEDIWYKTSNGWLLYINETGIKDVVIAGVSTVDSNGIADLPIPKNDSYYIRYLEHIYYWEAYVGGGYIIRDSERTGIETGTYNAGNHSLTFDLSEKYQRLINWGAGFYQYFENLGEDPEPYSGIAVGSYMVSSSFPIDKFRINDHDLYYTEYDIESARTDANKRIRSVNVIGTNGIDVVTTDDHDSVTLRLMATKDQNKPSVSNVFMNDSTYLDNSVAVGHLDEWVSYDVARNGLYLASILTTNCSNGPDILVYDTNNTDVTSSSVHILVEKSKRINHDSTNESGADSDWDDDWYLYGSMAVCTLQSGYKLYFKRTARNINRKDACMRIVSLLEHIDVTNISVDRFLIDDSVNTIYYNPSGPYHKTTTLEIPGFYYTDNIGKLVVQSIMTYGREDKINETTPKVDLDRSYTSSIAPYYDSMLSYTDFYGGEYQDGTFIKYTKRASVEYVQGPIQNNQSNRIYTNASTEIDMDAVDDIDITNYSSAFSVIFNVGNFDDRNIGYVTEEEFEDAVDDINDEMTAMRTSFQDGVDDIYDACVSKGSTPASYALADVVQGILDIPTGGGGGVILTSSAESVPMANVTASATMSATATLSSKAREE